jgi:drug/metabolite transporter (DMT)-like permease
MNPHEIGRGIGLSVLASTLFALLSGYTRLLAPLDGSAIFAWRILGTVLVALALIAWRGQLAQLNQALRQLLGTPGRCLLLLVMAALLGFQQWLFLWGSVNGRALEVSLGYFLLPLSMVLVGRFHYGEHGPAATAGGAVRLRGRGSRTVDDACLLLAHRGRGIGLSPLLHPAPAHPPGLADDLRGGTAGAGTVGPLMLGTDGSALPPCRHLPWPCCWPG